jgi:hypothetical protein
LADVPGKATWARTIDSGHDGTGGQKAPSASSLLLQRAGHFIGDSLLVFDNSLAIAIRSAEWRTIEFISLLEKPIDIFLDFVVIVKNDELVIGHFSHISTQAISRCIGRAMPLA